MVSTDTSRPCRAPVIVGAPPGAGRPLPAAGGVQRHDTSTSRDVTRPSLLLPAPGCLSLTSSTRRALSLPTLGCTKILQDDVGGKEKYEQQIQLLFKMTD